MIIESLFALALAASSQKERCAPADHHPSMVCVHRKGHCAVLKVDGQTAQPLTDEATARRIHAIKHGEDVCWQLTQPISSEFRVTAMAGGLDKSFLGELESISVNLYPLDDYDPALDSRLDSLNSIRLEADGHRNGTWQVRADRPLKSGEYVGVFRIYGEGNWDGPAVLLKIDAGREPAPADIGSKSGAPRGDSGAVRAGD